MSFTGSMEPNPDALGELFQAAMNHLSSNSTRLAMWLVEEFDLSHLDYQPIGNVMRYIIRFNHLIQNLLGDMKDVYSLSSAPIA